MDPDIEEAARVIEELGVVAAPTDTLVGLLALALDERAVAKVLAVKGAERAAPLPVLVEDMEAALRLVESLTPAGRELASRGWPGPMTLVVRARPGVFPVGITAGRATVGLRIPGPSPALELLRVVGRPLTGTSANRSGQTPPRSSDELAPEVVDAVDVVLRGRGRVDMASTVIDVTGEEPRVLRQGTFRL